MTAKEFQNVRDTIESEGSFEYAFRHYSDFKEIKDAKFHKLRKEYLAAHTALAEYINFDEDGL